MALLTTDLIYSYINANLILFSKHEIVFKITRKSLNVFLI